MVDVPPKIDRWQTVTDMPVNLVYRHLNQKITSIIPKKKLHKEVYMRDFEKRLDVLHTEHLKSEVDIHKTIQGVLVLIESMRKDIQSLRIDVDKLIENSCGCKKSA